MACGFQSVLVAAIKGGKQVVQRYCGFNQERLRVQTDLTLAQLRSRKVLRLRRDNPRLYQEVATWPCTPPQ